MFMQPLTTVNNNRHSDDFTSATDTRDTRNADTVMSDSSDYDLHGEPLLFYSAEQLATETQSSARAASIKATPADPEVIQRTHVSGAPQLKLTDLVSSSPYDLYPSDSGVTLAGDNNKPTSAMKDRPITGCSSPVLNPKLLKGPYSTMVCHFFSCESEICVV